MGGGVYWREIHLDWTEPERGFALVYIYIYFSFYIAFHQAIKDLARERERERSKVYGRRKYKEIKRKWDRMGEIVVACIYTL